MYTSTAQHSTIAFCEYTKNALSDLLVQGLDLLHSLTALTSLCLELVHMSDSSFRDLGRCQQLKDLAIKDATTTSAAGLVHLTQLTTLTRLEVTSLGKHNRFLHVSMLASSQVGSVMLLQPLLNSATPVEPSWQ